MEKLAVVILLLLFAFASRAFAYFNVTSLTTTVYLGNTSSAKVEEIIEIYMSNSSIPVYMQDRQALNQTLTQWADILGTSMLTEHIFNPKSSIQNFTLLPGPAVPKGRNGAVAYITMMYTANNVTTIKQIAPRKFEYTFNDACFNFEHTASGPALYANATLTIVLPKGAQVLMPIYPSPDSPIVNYANATSFSWFEAEPLNKFRLSYMLEESMQQEIVGFFTHLYP